MTRVVRAGISDLETLVPMFDAYRIFYKREGDLDGARAYLTARLERNEAMVFLALEISGAALGFALCYSTFSSVAMKPLVILNDLFVIPEARGQRIGEVLIGAAVELAQTSGAVGVQLETAHTNLSGQKLYERLGFQREDLVYRTYFLKV